MRFWVFDRDPKVVGEIVEVARGSIVQEVSVTGQVKAASGVNLAFERSGRVLGVNVKIGDAVKAGQLLLYLEAGDLAAQVLNAQGSLDAEKAKLEEMRKGSRDEEIKIAEAKAASAEADLADQKVNLENVKRLADAELDSDANDAATAMLKAVNIGKNALVNLAAEAFSGSDYERQKLTEAKGAAIAGLLGGINADYWNSQSVSLLAGGVYGEVQNAGFSAPELAAVQNLLPRVQAALFKVSTALAKVSSLSSDRTSVNSELAALSAKEQNIILQKANNASNIAKAEAAVNSAANSLAAAGRELELKKAPATPEQIAGQEARIKSAEAQVRNYQAQAGKAALRSPISGRITRQDAKAGEIVAASSVLITIAQESQFEIEAFIPEADIPKIEINDNARVTFDAFVPEAVFEAQVISVEQAETVIEGVTTYKTRFLLLKTDTGIKAGMTANLEIETDRRADVLFVPERVVELKDGRRTVQVLEAGSYREAEVETGLRGSDGYLEIVKGLTTGEKVVSPK